MAKLYYDQDANLDLLTGKKVAVIGYGSQGHAHALNLKESGIDVVVGLYKGSRSWKPAQEAGLAVMEAAQAAKEADIIMVLIPDEKQAKLYHESIEPNLEEGNILMFAHGFNIHFQQIKPPAFVDVAMVAPKGPGHTVRSQYLEGKGVPCLVAVYRIIPAGPGLCTGLCKGYRRYPGRCAETTFKRRPKPICLVNRLCCAGICELIKAGFETLVEAVISLRAHTLNVCMN